MGLNSLTGNGMAADLKSPTSVDKSIRFDQKYRNGIERGSDYGLPT